MQVERALEIVEPHAEEEKAADQRARDSLFATTPIFCFVLFLTRVLKGKLKVDTFFFF